MHADFELWADWRGEQSSMQKNIAYNVNINLADAGMQRLRFVFNADIAYYKKLCDLLRLHEVPGLGLVRVGREHDGGYLMLDDFPGEAEGQRIAYSFGIFDDVSWDLAMAERGYDVFMYDHTIEACPGSHERFHYHKLGIGAHREPENLLCTLEELLAANGHEQAEHMILKMDVEGAEWQVLDLMPDGLLQRFDQIVLELHWLVTSTEEAKTQEMLRVLSRLGRTHALVHLHGNNNASHLELGGQVLPDVIEVTYVSRSTYQVHALRSAALPSSLDMPNCEFLPEIILGSWRGALQGLEERKGGINMQLVTQKDNEGIFCYEPERLLTKIYGFHATEEAESDSPWTFMSGRDAAFMLNPSFLAGMQSIRFTTCSGAWVAGGDVPKVYFGIGNTKLLPMPPVADLENEIILPIDRHSEQEPLVVEIRLDITPEQSAQLRAGDGHQGYGLRLGQLRVE